MKVCLNLIKPGPSISQDSRIYDLKRGKQPRSRVCRFFFFEVFWGGEWRICWTAGGFATQQAADRALASALKDGEGSCHEQSKSVEVTGNPNQARCVFEDPE